MLFQTPTVHCVASTEFIIYELSMDTHMYLLWYDEKLYWWELTRLRTLRPEGEHGNYWSDDQL